jgi:putative addiction module component (TIGR02574 family)
MNQYLQQIRQLPVSEQLQLVEQIWEGLHDHADLVQEWHRVEGQRRLAELKREPDDTLTEDEMWSRVDELLAE